MYRVRIRVQYCRISATHCHEQVDVRDLRGKTHKMCFMDYPIDVALSPKEQSKAFTHK